MRRLSLRFFRSLTHLKLSVAGNNREFRIRFCGYASRSIEFEPTYLLDMLFTLALLSQAVKTFTVQDAHS